jgi:hypothetical protein
MHPFPLLVLLAGCIVIIVTTAAVSLFRRTRNPGPLPPLHDDSEKD